MTDEGLETMKTAGIMGALFGGVGGAVSSGQYLQRGAETQTGIRTKNSTEQMLKDGSLKLDKERRQDEEKIISAIKGYSLAELATWSDAQIVAEASILEGRYLGLISGEQEDMSTTRAAMDMVERLSGRGQNEGIRTEGEIGERGMKLGKLMGLSENDINEKFQTSTQASLIERARESEKQQAQENLNLRNLKNKRNIPKTQKMQKKKKN